MEPITIREILETKVFIVLCKCGAENKATLQNPTFNCKGCNKVIGKPDLKKQ